MGQQLCGTCIQTQAEGGQGQPLESKTRPHGACETDEEDIQRVESFRTDPVAEDVNLNPLESYNTNVPTKESFGTIIPDRHSFSTLLPDSQSFQTLPRVDSFSAYSHTSHQTHRTHLPHSRSFGTVVGAGSRCASFHADQPDPPRVGLRDKAADSKLYKDSLEAAAMPYSPQGLRGNDLRWQGAAKVVPT